MHGEKGNDGLKRREEKGSLLASQDDIHYCLFVRGGTGWSAHRGDDVLALIFSSGS